MASETLLVRRKGSVCTLILNYPEKRNVLTEGLFVELDERMREFSEDDSIRTVVIRGAGDEAFCSGYDISALTGDAAPESSGSGSNPFSTFEMALESIINYPYPVIAMLNGYAFGGGCELALSCDMRIGAEHIRMGMTPARIGMVYSLEGLTRFIRTIGLSGTKEIFFTGRAYDAPRAREMGLIDYMVPGAELETFTYQLAEEIAGNAPLSLKGIKRMLNLVSHGNQISAEDRKEAEKILANALNSHDLREGRAAFLEKRKPVFKGR